MKYIKLLIFFVLLSGLIFFGKIINASSIQSFNFNQYIYKWDYKNSYEKNNNNYFESVHKNLSDSTYPINAYFAPVIIRSNKLNNFYQWTNNLVFKLHYNLSQNCEKKVCKVEGRLFFRDSNYDLSDFNLFEESEVLFGVAEPFPDLNDNYKYKRFVDCETNQIRNDILDYTCYVPKSYSTNGYSYVMLNLKNKPYEDINSLLDYEENQFRVGVSTNLNITSIPYSFPELKVTVEDSTVKLDILNGDDFINDSEFNRFQVRYEHRKFGVLFSSALSYTFENVPNGDYSFKVSACGSGTQNCGAQAIIKYSVTNSHAPTVQFEIDNNNKNIIVDASSSFSYDGSAISKYYYQLYNSQTSEETEIIESTNSTYVFENYDYGTYIISVQVEDENGNKSLKWDLTFAHRSPTDKFMDNVNEFFGSIKDSITNFFINLGTFFVRLFIPEKQELQNKINSLQETLKKKLGFIGESVNFIIDEIEYMIIQPSAFNSICLPKTKMPEEMSGLEIIPEGEACLTANVMNNFSLITTVIKAIFSLLLIGWFVNYMYSEFLKILGGV